MKSPDPSVHPSGSDTSDNPDNDNVIPIDADRLREAVNLGKRTKQRALLTRTYANPPPTTRRATACVAPPRMRA
jgi:hypothetical protein